MRWILAQFELSRGGSVGHVKPMDGMRGFAVFLVFLVHYVTLAEPWLPERAVTTAFARSVYKIGNTGVDLFFVLSGYLIYGSLISRDQRFVRFISRRIQRIYPAFAVVFVTYLVLSFAIPSESKIPRGTAEGWIYVAQNFFLLPGLFPIEPMITVTWSLSYEMFYYLAIPLIIVAFRLKQRGPAWRIRFFLVTAGLISMCSLAYSGHVRLVMFIAGILLYEAMESQRLPTPSSVFGLVALSLGFLAVLVPLAGAPGVVLRVNALFFSFFVLCLACFRSPCSWLSQMLSWTPLRWLGNMSYSYYLLHGLVLKACFLGLSRVLSGNSVGASLFWLFLMPLFVVTLVPAAALFVLVERPFSLSPMIIPNRDLQPSLDIAPEYVGSPTSNGNSCR